MWKTWNNAQMIVQLRWLIRVDNDVNESDITATSHYKWVLFVVSLLMNSSLLSEMKNGNTDAWIPGLNIPFFYFNRF